MSNEIIKVEDFLNEVDNSFPVPLSEKQDLHKFAIKIYDKATVCKVEGNDKIVAMIAGYTDNVINNIAYVSVLATIKEAQGKGYAERLVREFINIAKSKNLDAVHLYTVATNIKAVALYKKVGFVEWKVENEQRPEDLHLIYHIKKG